MDVFEAIKWRRSIRKFSPKKIRKEEILRILESARLAPSSSNRQAWHFIVIDEKKIIEEIPKGVPPGTKGIITWIKDAPLVIIGCYQKALTHYIAQIFGHENHLLDISIAMSFMALEATELGIGTCFVGWFNESALKKLLNIPRRYRIAMLLALGYPAEPSNEKGIGGIPARPRKELGEIVSYNFFGNKLIGPD